MASRYFDYAIYAAAGIAICVVVGGAVSAEKASEQLVEEQKVLMSAPIAECKDGVCTPVSEPQCVAGSCNVTKQFSSNQPVQKTVRSCSTRVRRGIFFRWRRR